MSSSVRTVVVASRLAVGATTVLALLGGPPGLTWDSVALPLVLLALLLTLPHGAADAAAPYLGAARVHPAAYAGLGLAYVVLVVATWTVVHAVPVLGLVLLLGVSVLHFGAGETEFHRATGTVPPRGWSLVTGLVVVVLPLAAHPRQTGTWLLDLVPQLGTLVPDPYGPDLLRTSALVAVVVTASAGLLAARSWRHGPRRPAGELVLLTGCALLAPPVITIAVYLAAWHSPRHLVLLAQDARRAGRRLRPLVAAAALATAAPVVVLAVVVIVEGAPDPVSVLREQLWLITALTIPHAVVVAWLDRIRARPLPGVPGDPDRSAPAGAGQVTRGVGGSG